jgi:hypothetical protein
VPSVQKEQAYYFYIHRLRWKCDGTRAETRFRLSAKRTSPFKSAGASVQSNTGNLDERISGSNAGYTMFRGSVKSTGYLLHSPVSPSLSLPCVTVCHHISTGLYLAFVLFNTFYSYKQIYIYIQTASVVCFWLQIEVPGSIPGATRFSE